MWQAQFHRAATGTLVTARLVRVREGERGAGNKERDNSKDKLTDAKCTRRVDGCDDGGDGDEEGELRRAKRSSRANEQCSGVVRRKFQVAEKRIYWPK